MSVTYVTVLSHDQCFAISAPPSWAVQFPSNNLGPLEWRPFFLENAPAVKREAEEDWGQS
jgi:hypothetical protein